MPQDPRMNEVAVGAADDFLSEVANNNNHMVKGFLEMLPTLIYATDSLGNTAINNLIIRGTEADLNSLKVILEATKKNGIAADLNQQNINGYNVYDELDIHNESSLNHLFVEAINAYQQSPYEQTLPINLDNSLKEQKDKNDNCNTESKKESSCTIFKSHDIYYHDLCEILKNLPPLNMDQQVEFNTMDARLNEILEAQSSYLSATILINSVGSEESVFILSTVFFEFLGKLQDYFFANLELK